MLCIFALLSCGLEEHYYLPQIPENVIRTNNNNQAEIRIPSNLLNGVDHYANGYVIFYKIYTNDFISDSPIDLINNISNLSTDYRSLFSFTDPSNASSIPSLSTFSNRGFYELELENVNIRDTVLTKSGGFFRLFFPTVPGRIPYLDQDETENENEYNLSRSNGGGTFTPRPDRSFIASTELRDSANAISTINADVSGQSGIPDNAYALMYIVAVGTNLNNFNRIYGKPTYISVFKLTQSN